MDDILRNLSMPPSVAAGDHALPILGIGGTVGKTSGDTRLRHMNKSIDGIIWEADPDTLQFSRVEGNVFEILGFSSDEWLNQPDFWQSRLHEEDAEWVINACLAATRERKPHRLTYRMRAADGRAVWLQDNVTVNFDAESATVSGVMIDVTELVEQRQELAALNLQNARYRALYDLVPVAIWEEDWTGVMDVMRKLKAEGVRDIFDYPSKTPGFVESLLARLKVLAVNKAALDMFRAESEQELIRRAPEIFVADDPHSVFQTALNAILRGETRLDGKNRLRRLDGEEVHVMFRIALPDIEDAHPRVVICEMDVSAETKANERFELVTHATSDVIWDFDIVNDTLWSSEGLQRVFGLDPGQMHNSLENWTARIHPDDLPRAMAQFDEILYDGRNDWIQEYRFRRGDESYAIVKDEGHVLRDRAGRAVRMVGSLVDITEQRKLEARLVQSQKLEAMGRLTGGIAHDFNNLLTIILGSLEALEERVRGDDVALRHLAPALQAVDRSTELISQLLSYARKQPLAPRAINMSQQLMNTMEMITRALGETIDVAVRTQSGLWRFRADPGQFDNALLNLGINARDAMPDGGTLTIASRNTVIESSNPLVEKGLTPGKYVLVAVADTGHGMDLTTSAQAFDPFFTTKEVGAGSGLGLSMVQGFAHQSNGLANIRSTPGQGTIVELYLPALVADVSRAPDAAPDAIKPPSGDGQILLVEDQDMVREHIVVVLESLGYSVMTADCAAKAVEILKDNPPPDLLLTDIVLPGGVSGLMLAETARTLFPDLPVRFTSGYSETGFGAATSEHLIAGQTLLRKPFRRRELATFVREAIHGP